MSENALLLTMPDDFILHICIRDENGTGKPAVRYGTGNQNGTVNLHDEIIDWLVHGVYTYVYNGLNRLSC